MGGLINVVNNMTDVYRKCPDCGRIYLVDKSRCLSSVNCFGCGWYGFAFQLLELADWELDLAEGYDQSDDKTAFLKAHPQLRYTKSGLLIEG